MKILITGVSGFLGSHLARHLHANGHTVSGLLRAQSQRPDLPAGIALHDIDPHPQSVNRALTAAAPDVVVHLAAHYVAEHQPDDIAPLVRSNIEFGAQMLDAMAHKGCSALVTAGSVWQHGDTPVNLYAATKNAFSVLAGYYRDATGLREISLALYDSYGPDDRRPKLINLLKLYAASADSLDMTPGEQLLHLVHIDDLVRGFAMACDQVMDLPSGEKRCYRLPSEQARTLRDVVARFNAADPSRPVSARWGAKPYRAREVLAPWEDAPPLPGWHPRIGLAEGLEQVRAAPDSKEV